MPGPCMEVLTMALLTKKLVLCPFFHPKMLSLTTITLRVSLPRAYFVVNANASWSGAIVIQEAPDPPIADVVAVTPIGISV